MRWASMPPSLAQRGRPLCCPPPATAGTGPWLQVGRAAWAQAPPLSGVLGRAGARQADRRCPRTVRAP